MLKRRLLGILAASINNSETSRYAGHGKRPGVCGTGARTN